jgi:Peptidase family M28/Secretion system C-terminal sorting domain
MKQARLILGIILWGSIFALNVAEGQQDTSKVRRMMNAISDTTLIRHITTLGYSGGTYNRVSYTPGNHAVVDYIGSTMKQSSRLSVANDTFYVTNSPPTPFDKLPAVNVIGTLRGKTDPNRYVVVCAHLDCSAGRMPGNVFQTQWQTIRTLGADDNATGIAAVLELARILSDTSFGFTPDYSIVFAAMGDEEGIPGSIGLAGSAHFAEDAHSHATQILGVINLDMLGFNPKKIYADIFSNPSSQWIGEQCLAVNRTYGLGIGTNQPPFANAGYSDHVSFWNAGYPAIMIIEHAFPWTSDSNYVQSPYYHTSWDTLGTLNLPMVKALAQMSLGALVNLSKSSATFVPLTSSAPTDFSLEQNYPNPFNPSTQIRFSLASEQVIELKILDVLGRSVGTVVAGRFGAGSHTAVWDASNVPSGVYFYTLRSVSSSVTRRMVVMK